MRKRKRKKKHGGNFKNEDVQDIEGFKGKQGRQSNGFGGDGSKLWISSDNLYIIKFASNVNNTLVTEISVNRRSVNMKAKEEHLFFSWYYFILRK